MNENISKAIDYAFSNNINEMGKEIEDALMQKVADALAGKRIEVAQTLMSPVSEDDEGCDDSDMEDSDDESEGDEEEDEKPKKKLKGKQKELDKDGDIDEKDLAMLRKEDYEDLLEKLSPEMGAEKYIHDFVHSDNPKFEGKSKKERIQMALGAYYSAKKGKTRNEEVEELDEVSKKLMLQYLQANKASKNPNSQKRIKGTQMAVGKWTGNYGKVPATGKKEGVIAGKPSK